MIVRRGVRGDVQVVVVHRPERIDWSFPKGKVEPGESLEACAVREVFEETGFRCSVGPLVGCTEYVDRKERPKVVVYWLMQRESGFFTPVDEVDEVRWAALDEAEGLLTYERDRELLPAVDAVVRATSFGEVHALSA